MITRPLWNPTGTLLSFLLFTVLYQNQPVYSSAVPQHAFKLDTPRSLAPETIGPNEHGSEDATTLPSTVHAMLNALEVMQEKYFDVFTGTWPTSIDWTAAVLGTQVSATLSSLVSSLQTPTLSCSNRLALENIIDRYFAHTSIFYFGEDSFRLRNEAYDDMLWVVLGWLESIKFMKMYSSGYWEESGARKVAGRWHGLQFSRTAAHRAGIFYDLASQGWDTSLCNGGMNWNPQLTPYKNAITNELFISASISMYLYFPGDNNTSPYFGSSSTENDVRAPHDTEYLANAIKAYKWLKESSMQNAAGLYQDGFHVSGWRRYPNGTTDPGTGKCDELNTMVYTYNQGVLLTASRGLWMATGAQSYLDEGHALVESVVKATGWPKRDRLWRGLGRDGILEEFCDHGGYCSQDGQTFKGIFFLHLAEFCRPLWAYEEEFINLYTENGLDKTLYNYHKARCATYGSWIAHNANAASVTRDPDGLFGMWWGREYPDAEPTRVIAGQMHLLTGAVDHMNAATRQGRIWGSSKAVADNGVVPAGCSLASLGPDHDFHDVNDRGRGRSVETQSGGLAILRAHWQWTTLLKEYI